MQIALLSSVEDCTANQALYADLLRYPETYQYFLSPELRHTLFSGDVVFSLIAIGYPDGWIETIDSEYHRVILPFGAAYAQSPAVRVYRPSQVDDGQTDALFGVSLEDIPTQTPIEFSNRGRHGYLRRSSGAYGSVIEYSAPSDQFAANAELLHRMATTTWNADPPEN
ncbi:MAG: hypothetical protein U0670_20790 [Anaerolineae bacterium]